MKRDSLKSRTITVIYKEVAYVCDVAQIPTDSLDPDNPLQCPYCGAFLGVVGETYQQGRYQDKGTLKLICRKHPTLFVYNYHVGAMEPTTADGIEADASAAV